MKYNEYINDFGYYLNLVLNWDVKKTVLDFNKPFKRLSLSQNDHILRKWNKFGFRPLFKTFSFWTFFGVFPKSVGIIFVGFQMPVFME